MAFLTKQDIDILRNIKITKILGIKDVGRKESIRCPFLGHNDKTPSLVIYPDNGYYCYGCGKVGFGAIDFCEDLGFSFIESINFLVKHK